MAIEITFGIRGKETTQALFIQESDWEIPLTKLRQLIEEQSLFVPLEYKFETLKNNAIAHPAEENIVLKEIVSYSSNQKEQENEPKLEEFGMTSEIGGESIKKTTGTPKIWITPLKVTFSSATPANDATSSGTSASSTGDEGMCAPGGEDDPLLGGEGNENQGRQCSSCPYKIFVDFLHGRKGPPNPKTVLKILFLLTFLLFSMLATLTLTLHLMVSSFTNVARSPAMVDLFSQMGNGRGESSETVTNLQMKLSQLEVSSKYEIDQLTTRLIELEDLYLRDLAIHKKELNLIKKQIAQDNDAYAEEEEGVDFEESRNYERNNKEPKRKSGGMKSSDRIKG